MSKRLIVSRNVLIKQSQIRVVVFVSSLKMGHLLCHKSQYVFVEGEIYIVNFVSECVGASGRKCGPVDPHPHPRLSPKYNRQCPT